MITESVCTYCNIIILIKFINVATFYFCYLLFSATAMPLFDQKIMSCKLQISTVFKPINI